MYAKSCDAEQPFGALTDFAYGGHIFCSAGVPDGPATGEPVRIDQQHDVGGGEGRAERPEVQRQGQVQVPHLQSAGEKKQGCEKQPIKETVPCILIKPQAD